MGDRTDRRELTWTAIVLGIGLAAVFGAANAYLGLRVGLTVSASVPAAVISMGVLRFVLRRTSVLENNMVQTIGSAGEALAGGVIYTMPALYLWADEGLCAPPGFLSLTVIALLGGLLGVLFMVPIFCRFSDAAAAVYAEGGVVAVWREYVRYVGAGAIAAGGFFSLVKSVPLFVRTFRDSWRGVRGGPAGEDLPLGRVVAGVVCIVALLAFLPVVPVGVGGALLMALFGFFFAAVSARMVGLVGSSNNPISGMTIATLVVSAFALKACGTVGAAGMIAGEGLCGILLALLTVMA